MPEDAEEPKRARRARLLAVERSLLDCPGLRVAAPTDDADGSELILFRTGPFRAVPVLLLDASGGLTVRREFAEEPLALACVLDPFGPLPLVAALSGAEAWNLPIRYVQRGGSAADRETFPQGYRWPRTTPLLCRMLEERAATPARWTELFAQLVDRAP
ncbi:MAG: hypothetical protein Q4E05_11455 [Pseudoclavibacter sp.]|nr:hypothetical protein [Pseudoclavibacter sp.]